MRNPAPASSRVWRLAGALAIAHVVLMFASFSLQKVAPLGAANATIAADHIAWSTTKGYVGEWLTVLSFLTFLAAAALLTRLLRGATEISQWLSATSLAAATIYVTLTLVGVAGLGTALYDGHHGSALSDVALLVRFHWFAIFLGTIVLGVFTAGVALSVISTRLLPRWVGYAGLVPGLLCLAVVPGLDVSLVNLATVVWVLWFVAIGVTAVRGPRELLTTTPLAEPASLG